MAEVRAYVISSQSQFGFWSNRQGWVYDVRSASRFHADQDLLFLQIAGVSDGTLILADEATDFDPNQEYARATSP